MTSHLQLASVASWGFFKEFAIPGNHLRPPWHQELDSGELLIVLQNIPKPHPELPNIALAIKYAKTEEAREMIRAVVRTVGPPYVLPPERQSRISIRWMATLEKSVKEVFNLDPLLVPKLKAILK